MLIASPILKGGGFIYIISQTSLNSINKRIYVVFHIYGICIFLLDMKFFIIFFIQLISSIFCLSFAFSLFILLLEIPPFVSYMHTIVHHFTYLKSREREANPFLFGFFGQLFMSETVRLTQVTPQVVQNTRRGISKLESTK